MQTSDTPSWKHAFETAAPAARRNEPATAPAPEPTPSTTAAERAAEEPERWDGMS